MGRRIRNAAFGIGLGLAAIGAGYLWPVGYSVSRDETVGQEPVKEIVVEKRTVPAGEEPIKQIVNEKTTVISDANYTTRQGDVLWTLTADTYKTKSDKETVDKIRVVVDTNVKANPNLAIDNRAVVDGKVIEAPDGIPGDVLYANQTLVYPNAKETIVEKSVEKIVGYRAVTKTVEEKVEKVTGYKDVKQTVSEPITRFPGLDGYGALATLTGAAMGSAVLGIGYILKRNLRKVEAATAVGTAGLTSYIAGRMIADAIPQIENIQYVANNLTRILFQ